MFKRLGLAWSITGFLMIGVFFWPVQVVTVTLPKQNNRTLAIMRIHPDDEILFSYRHSVELTRVEGRFQVTPESELVVIDTRMESVGTGLPNAYPARTTKEDGWLVVDEHKKTVGTLRFFVVPINQVQLIIANRPIDLSDLESGSLVQVSAHKITWPKWMWWKVRN